MIKVIDNFLNDKDFDEIKKTFENFYWYYLNNISNYYDKSKIFNRFGFYHVFIRYGIYTNTPYKLIIKNLLEKQLKETNCNFILRSRADMTVYHKEKIIHDPHVDFLVDRDKVTQNHISTIFYVNNSDGDTVIYKEKAHNISDITPTPNLKNLTILKKIKPVANRLLIFSGNYIHTGHSPKNHSNRILINSNFDIK